MASIVSRQAVALWPVLSTSRQQRYSPLLSTGRQQRYGPYCLQAAAVLQGLIVSQR